MNLHPNELMIVLEMAVTSPEKDSTPEGLPVTFDVFDACNDAFLRKLAEVEAYVWCKKICGELKPWYLRDFEPMTRW